MTSLSRDWIRSKSQLNRAMSDNDAEGQVLHQGVIDSIESKYRSLTSGIDGKYMTKEERWSLEEAAKTPIGLRDWERL